jgi:uncharacterized alkaline shock family protein YloU
VKVYGLVGRSGTGKSYQAMNLCREINVESIIDDGLFIFGNSIMAGISAKRQSTKIAAIKTALFTDEEHRKTVADKIKEIQPDSILILGTSIKMLHRIAERLELPKIERIIQIEAITSESEREAARKQRHELGKHVIPVPTFQLKREFSGYFLDPLRIFRGWRGGKASFSERSVVRPTYSYLGDYSISDKVIGDVVNYIGRETDGVESILRVNTDSNSEGISITVLVMMSYGIKLMDVAKDLQKKIAKQVETMTAFHIRSVDIEIRGLK